MCLKLFSKFDGCLILRSKFGLFHYLEREGMLRKCTPMWIGVAFPPCPPKNWVSVVNLIYLEGIFRECEKSREATARSVYTRGPRIVFWDIMNAKLKFEIMEWWIDKIYLICPNRGKILKEFFSKVQEKCNKCICFANKYHEPSRDHFYVILTKS